MKIYIDGSEGTTGLRINERFQVRNDIELLTIPSELRKDPTERKKYINESDITFLCLPDAAAIEAVSMVENENVRIIDASTAHRTLPDWAYGFPELSPAFRDKIRNGKRIAVPGCHASGFVALAYPLVAGGLIEADYPIVSFSLTGYSGGGKKMIAEYEAQDKGEELFSPREYALSQQHKHLKEMKAVVGLKQSPCFSPIVDDYYNGMVVTIPMYAHLMKKYNTPTDVWKYFSEYYADEKFMKVMPFGEEANYRGFMAGNGCAGWDGMEIYVSGNEERILLNARFDNLGKGASGAAIQCLNIMMGIDEAYGLNL